MTETQVQSAAFEAARWWGQQIKEPRFDNGSGDFSNLFAGALAGRVAELRGEPTPAQVTLFCAHLTQSIIERMNNFASFGETDHPVTIGVDYGPDKMLADAADHADISQTRFPWKTMMMVRPDHVVASLGARAQMSLVWASPEWYANRPICGTGDYGPDGLIRTNYICGMPKYHECSGHGMWKEDPARCKHCGGSRYDHFKPEGIVYRRGSEGEEYHPWLPIE